MITRQMLRDWCEMAPSAWFRVEFANKAYAEMLTFKNGGPRTKQVDKVLLRFRVAFRKALNV